MQAGELFGIVAMANCLMPIFNSKRDLGKASLSSANASLKKLLQMRRKYRTLAVMVLQQVISC